MFIFLLTSEALIRKAVTTVGMVNYLVFLIFILISCCTVGFFIIMFLSNRKNRVSNAPPPKKVLFSYFIISIGDTVSFIMIILSAAYITASTSTILMQAVIPVTMVLSYLFLKRRYHLVHYVSAFILLAAILADVIKDTSDSDHDAYDFTWMMVGLLSAIPASIASVFKEITMVT